VACLRSAVAAFVLALVLPQARRFRDARLLGVAAAYAATLVTFVRATKLTTAASAIFLQSAAPLYVLALGPLLLKERIRRRDLGFMAAFAVGLVLMLSGTDVPTATAPDPGAGNRWAVVSALAYALTIVGLRHAARRDPDAAMSAVVLGNVLAALGALPGALPLHVPSATDVAVLVYLGVFQIGLAYMLMARGMQHVAAFEASLLLLVEPVLNPLWAWILQKEVPEAASLGGGAVILGTTALMTWRERNAASQEGNPGDHVSVGAGGVARPGDAGGPRGDSV
jgi:DME family drug/metabolite transporter